MFSRHSIAHHFLVDEMRYMVKKNYKELFNYDYLYYTFSLL